MLASSQKACEAAEIADWGTGTNLISTGKYKIGNNDDTTEVVLERFDDYRWQACTG